MPQTTNRQLVRDTNNMPVGRGTVYNSMLKISAATWERARKVNEGEQLRLSKVTRVMERHQRVSDNAQNRVLEKVQKQLKDLQAFRVVLRDHYSVDKFRTLKVPEPRMSDRRRRLETMFYTTGFSQKSMQPEIRRQIRRTDPERMRQKLKRHLLEYNREEVVRLAARNSKESNVLLRSTDASVNFKDIISQPDTAGYVNEENDRGDGEILSTPAVPLDTLGISTE